MNTEDIAKLMQTGADNFDEMLRRPRECSELEMELKSAMKLKDLTSGDNSECVRLLLDAGADVIATDCDGWTCLFHVRSERVARYLLERGAGADMSDQCGGLPEDSRRVPIGVRRMLREWRTGRQRSGS